jgi:hypothetical protein
MNRIFAHLWTTCLDLQQHHPQRRWLILTLVMAASSNVVAYAVPFFKDLVALIGALTCPSHTHPTRHFTSTCDASNFGRGNRLAIPWDRMHC